MVEIVVRAGNSTLCLGAQREVQLPMSQPSLTCSGQRVPAALHRLQDVSFETSNSAALRGCIASTSRTSAPVYISSFLARDHLRRSILPSKINTSPPAALALKQAEKTDHLVKRSTPIRAINYKLQFAALCQAKSTPSGSVRV